MSRDYAQGVIHALLLVGVLMSLLTAGLAAVGLMTLAACFTLGTTLLFVWGVAYFVWFFWG